MRLTSSPSSFCRIECRYNILRLAKIYLIGIDLVSKNKASIGILGWAANIPLNNDSSTFSNIAKLSSSWLVMLLVELRLALSLIISTPTPTRESRDAA